MNERSKLQDLVGPHDSTRMMDALKRGASRRDVLAMLMAGGMQATLAGGLATLALSAHAATPKRGGRIRVATRAAGERPGNAVRCGSRRLSSRRR